MVSLRFNSRFPPQAKVTFRFHGAQNIFSAGNEDVASLHWKRGSKKQNTGHTENAEVIFGMATWKHTLDMEVTFFQDKKTKAVDPKELALTLKVGKKDRKLQTVAGSALLDLADFHRDGTKVDKILPISQGSNPTTLKVTIETLWTHIDNKLIVRGKTGRPVRSKDGSATDEEDAYDLQTVTFDSEDDELTLGGEKIEFSEGGVFVPLPVLLQSHGNQTDEDSPAAAASAAPKEDQSALIEELRKEIEILQIVNEQAKVLAHDALCVLSTHGSIRATSSARRRLSRRTARLSRPRTTRSLRSRPREMRRLPCLRPLMGNCRKRKSAATSCRASWTLHCRQASLCASSTSNRAWCL
jgi:hypothetical protein